MSIWCRHRNQTMPRRDEEGEYRRCLDCAARIAWSWPDDFLIRSPRLVQSKNWEAFFRSLGAEQEAEVQAMAGIGSEETVRGAEERPIGGEHYW